MNSSALQHQILTQMSTCDEAFQRNNTNTGCKPIRTLVTLSPCVPVTLTLLNHSLCSDIMALLYSPSFDFDIFYFYSQCLYENILFSVLSIH